MHEHEKMIENIVDKLGTVGTTKLGCSIICSLIELQSSCPNHDNCGLILVNDLLSRGGLMIVRTEIK